MRAWLLIRRVPHPETKETVPEVYIVALAAMEGAYADGGMPQTAPLDWKTIAERLWAVGLNEAAIAEAKLKLDKNLACTIRELELNTEQLRKIGYTSDQIQFA